MRIILDKLTSRLDDDARSIIVSGVCSALDDELTCVGSSQGKECVVRGWAGCERSLFRREAQAFSAMVRMSHCATGIGLSTTPGSQIAPGGW